MVCVLVGYLLEETGDKILLIETICYYFAVEVPWGNSSAYKVGMRELNSLALLTDILN